MLDVTGSGGRSDKVTEIVFQVWGCRGGRNTHGSRIGNLTSCYSLRVGDELFVFDAGRGLVVLSEAVFDDARLRGISRIHMLVTHAHMDHWEGLKDAAWLWRPKNGLEVTVLGPAEALDTIRRAHEPPSFVPLEVLAAHTLASLAFVPVLAGASIPLPGASLRAVALHHYSGVAPHERHLDTLGYHLAIEGGPAVAYLSDHQPTAESRTMERMLLAASQLAVLDANYGAIHEHAFGHGSVEYAAELAREHPATSILAAHHGPLRSDDAIEDAHRRFGGASGNLIVAAENAVLRWDVTTARFVVA